MGTTLSSNKNRFFPRPFGWLTFILIFTMCAIAPVRTRAAEKQLSKDDCAKLMGSQGVEPDRPIFDADTFPKIDFPNKDLIMAALGPYSLKIRYFDAAYSEMPSPAGPGRYGARVEVEFSNGFSRTYHVTLFKTPKPYRTYRNRYDLTVRLPEAFGLSHGVQAREEWNTQDFFFDLIRSGARHSNASAMLVASLYDIEADPVRLRGFSSWHVDDAWWSGLERKLGTSQEYKRIVTLPDGYAEKPDQHWPMILFLHGSGQRGDDLDMLKDQGPLGYINKGHPLPFIVVTPQCPWLDWWGPENLARLVDQIEAQYRVDSKRIYVTGLSLGGFGSFVLAATYPKRFAAIAPLSGFENPGIAERLKTVPTWIFHGAEDRTVPLRYSTDIADKMKAVGAAEVKLTVYPDVGHEKWDVTYSDPELYAWFLKHALP